MKKQRVAVLFGGKSAEHEISILTALQAMDALDTRRFDVVPIYIASDGCWLTGSPLLDKAFYRSLPESLTGVKKVECSLSSAPFLRVRGKPLDIDVFFLCFHGQHGEDGCIQGILEWMGAAYTGCNVLSSAVSMNKPACKAIAKMHGIPVLPHSIVSRSHSQKDFSAAVNTVLENKELGSFPLFVKPANLGSSVGIAAAPTKEELEGALAKVFQLDTHALVEPCVTDLLEINVAVLEGSPPRASIVEMPIASGAVLSYEDKYLRGGSKFGNAGGMASLSRVIDPEDLPQDLKDLAKELAVKTFQATACAGVVRFDFIYDKKTGSLYFNEMNAIPGSLAYYLWEKSNPQLLYPDLIEHLIEGANRRKAEKLSLKQELGFKALQ